MEKRFTISVFLLFIFITLIIVGSEGRRNDIALIGCTELNGNGCVCHSLDRDTSVTVWVEGPDTLYVGQMGLYKMYLTGGPAEAGGYNVAGRFGTMVLVDSFSYQHPLAMNELTQAFSLPFATPEDTIYWEFGYLASDSSSVDTIYSCGISLVWDTIPDPLDRWNFGPKFPLTILDNPVSVENESNIPQEFTLYQNYPNPFNPGTVIKYAVGERQYASLKVYDVIGNEVATLVNEVKEAGEYEVKFNAEGLPSGIYIYRVQTGSYTASKKMILLK